MNDIKKPSSVKTVLVLTCICTAIALLVSGVYSLTKEKIAQNDELKTEKAISGMFPGYTEKKIVDGTFDEKINAIYEVKTNDSVSYAADVTAKGYGADGINMMVGIDNGGKVISVVIVSASGETPGLGQNITKKEYTDGFSGISLGEKADVISGATISSNGVQSGVDACLEAVNSIINEGGAAE